MSIWKRGHFPADDVRSNAAMAEEMGYLPIEPSGAPQATSDSYFIRTVGNPFVQQAVAGATATTAPVALGSNTTSGNCLVLIININSDPTSVWITGVADTQSNTWVRGPHIFADDGVFGKMVEIWYAANITGGATTVTATLSGGPEHSVSVTEWTNVQTVTPSGGGAKKINGAVTAYGAGSIIPPSYPAIIVAGLNADSTASPTLDASTTAPMFVALSDSDHGGVDGRSAYAYLESGSLDVAWTGASGWGAGAALALLMTSASDPPTTIAAKRIDRNDFQAVQRGAVI